LDSGETHSLRDDPDLPMYDESQEAKTIRFALKQYSRKNQKIYPVEEVLIRNQNKNLKIKIQLY